MIDVYRRPLDLTQSLRKSLFDCTTAAILLMLTFLLMLTLPVMLFVVMAVHLDSPGSVLFRQKRFGIGNRIIGVHKLRTMRVELTDHGGARQAEEFDDRVRGMGRFLRRTRIDELPQLLNVLGGDLSLVGPRPMPLEMRVENKLNHEIVAEYPCRHRLRPGLHRLGEGQRLPRRSAGKKEYERASPTISIMLSAGRSGSTSASS